MLEMLEIKENKYENRYAVLVKINGEYTLVCYITSDLLKEHVEKNLKEGGFEYSIVLVEGYRND